MFTVKDLLEMDIDMDVCDDYDESVFIAFVGPVELTDEGMKEFGSVLDTEVRLNEYVALLLVKDDEKRLRKLHKLFYSLAGFCSEKDWDKWFVDE